MVLLLMHGCGPSHDGIARGCGVCLVRPNHRFRIIRAISVAHMAVPVPVPVSCPGAVLVGVPVCGIFHHLVVDTIVLWVMIVCSESTRQQDTRLGSDSCFRRGLLRCSAFVYLRPLFHGVLEARKRTFSVLFRAVMRFWILNFRSAIVKIRRFSPSSEANTEYCTQVQLRSMTVPTAWW